MDHPAGQVLVEAQSDGSEARLRRILDNVVAMVGSLTPEGILTEANEPALAVANLKRSDVIGKPFWDTYWWNYSSEVQERLKQAIGKAASGETVRYDEDVRIIDDQLISIDFKISPVFDGDGNVVELTPSGVDITSRKQAERSLRDSEERLSQILNNVNTFIGLLDTDGVLTEVNTAALDAAGAEFADVIGHRFEDTPWWALSDEVRTELRGIVEQSLAGQTLRRDLRYRGPDGKRRWVDFQIAPVRAPDGKVVAVVPSGVDITDRKRAENRLQRSHDTFYNLVQHSPFGVFIVDGKFRLAQFSAGAEKVFHGIDPLIGRDFAEILRIVWPEPFASEAVNRFRHTLATGEAYHAPDTTEHRANVDDVESYDWKIERIELPDGGFGVVCYFYDLTAQKKAEAALADSQAAYRHALRSARAAAWEWQVADDVVTWSREFADLLQIDSEQFPTDIAGFCSLMMASERDDFLAAIRREFDSGGDSFEQQFRIRQGDGGGLLWLRASGRIERDADGKPSRVVGLISDIDELRRAQITSDRRDAHIANLLNSTAEGIYGIDLKGVCTFANPACAELLGYASVGDLVGRQMHELVHHHHEDGTPYPTPECRIYQAFKSGEPLHVDDEVFWRADASSFPVEYWSHPIKEKDQITGAVVTFLDMTARRTAERELRTAVDRLSLALDVGEMGVWDWDMRSGRVEWSDTHFTLAGYAVGEVEPSYEAWRDRVHPDDLEAVEKALERAKKEGGTYESSFRFLHPDGTVVHVMARGQYFHGAGGGEPVRMIGVIDDITGLKVAEEHRELLMAELNHRVKNTLATIQAMASHTLRNAGDMESFREAFIGRLQAISSAHEILFASDQSGALLKNLIHRQVGPYADLEGDQVRIEGPHVILDPTSAHALGLVLHELATNAAKYGALSTATGRVAIEWQVAGNGEDRKVLLRWQESAGPPVSEPDRKGFGSRLIEQTLTHTLDGKVDLVFAPEGFSASLELPVETSHG